MVGDFAVVVSAAAGVVGALAGGSLGLLSTRLVQRREDERAEVHRKTERNERRRAERRELLGDLLSAYKRAELEAGRMEYESRQIVVASVLVGISSTSLAPQL